MLTLWPSNNPYGQKKVLSLYLLLRVEPQIYCLMDNTIKVQELPDVEACW